VSCNFFVLFVCVFVCESVFVFCVMMSRLSNNNYNITLEVKKMKHTHTHGSLLERMISIAQEQKRRRRRRRLVKTSFASAR